jgi:hypothetical protein
MSAKELEAENEQLPAYNVVKLPEYSEKTA